MRPITNNVPGVHSMPAAPRRVRHRKWWADVRTLRLAHMHWLHAKTKCRKAFGVRHHGSPSRAIFHSTLFYAASDVSMHHSAEMSAAEGTRSRQIRKTDAIGIALRTTLRQFAVVQWSWRCRQIHTEILQLCRSMDRRGNFKNVGHCAGEWARNTIDWTSSRGHLRFSIARGTLVCTESDEIIFGRRPHHVLVAESNSERRTYQHLLLGYPVGHGSASESFVANENVSLRLRTLQWCDRIGHQLQCTALHSDRMPRSHAARFIGEMEFGLDVSDFEGILCSI